MDVHFSVRAPVINQRVIDLCGEALTSHNPPLTPDSQEKIAEIEAARIRLVEGQDKFHVVKFFEALATLTPLQGALSKNLFIILAQCNFSLQALNDRYGQQRRDDRTTEADSNEWGFFTERVRLSGNKLGPEITLDLLKDDRDSAEIVSELIEHLRAISSPGVRQQLVEDCSKIIDLRLDFDID